MDSAFQLLGAKPLNYVSGSCNANDVAVLYFSKISQCNLCVKRSVWGNKSKGGKEKGGIGIREGNV